jgi:hypothetical protein
MELGYPGVVGWELYLDIYRSKIMISYFHRLKYDWECGLIDGDRFFKLVERYIGI